MLPSPVTLPQGEEGALIGVQAPPLRHSHLLHRLLVQFKPVLVVELVWVGAQGCLNNLRRRVVGVAPRLVPPGMSRGGVPHSRVPRELGEGGEVGEEVQGEVGEGVPNSRCLSKPTGGLQETNLLILSR